MLELVPALAKTWTQDRGTVEATAAKAAKILRSMDGGLEGGAGGFDRRLTI